MVEVFTCERDGFVMRGANDDELVAQVERHIAEAHPDLVGKLSREDITSRKSARGPRSIERLVASTLYQTTGAATSRNGSQETARGGKARSLDKTRKAMAAELAEALAARLRGALWQRT